MSSLFDRSVPPLAGEVRGSRFPAFVRTRLANGLDLYLARWPHTPLVSLQLLLPAGGQFQEPAAAGLASLHGALLDEGTETRSALEIASSVERLGGFLGTGADWDVAYVSSTVLSTNVEAGLELVADLALAPCFPDDEIERSRRHRLAEIRRSRKQPATLAERRLARVVYEGTVYAEPLAGTEESVRALGRPDLADFYRRHAVPEGSSFVAVGDLEPDALAARLEAVFGSWSRAAGVAPVERPAIEPAARLGLEIHLVDRPGSAQTQLLLGRSGIARDDPDHPKALLMSVILGGKFTSRLNLNLREKHGITYGTHSHFVFRQGTGPFVVRLAVATDAVGTAVREILFEMKRLRDDLVPEEELRETQDYLRGVFPITLQTVADLAKRLETLAIFSLPDDYYTGYPDVVGEVTRDEVREVARRYLETGRLAVVAVGPADELRGQLEELGPVKVWTP